MAKDLYSAIILADSFKVPGSLVSLVASRCEETILVAADPLRHHDFDGLIVAPGLNRHQPYGAIYAGLFAARHDHALVVDGRRPGLIPEMLRGLLDVVETRWDVVITSPGTGLDPCLAVYSKRCLKPLAKHLGQDVFNAEALFSTLNKHVLAQPELRNWDPGGASLKRIDTVQD